VLQLKAFLINHHQLSLHIFETESFILKKNREMKRATSVYHKPTCFQSLIEHKNNFKNKREIFGEL